MERARLSIYVIAMSGFTYNNVLQTQWKNMYVFPTKNNLSSDELSSVQVTYTGFNKFGEVYKDFY